MKAWREHRIRYIYQTRMITSIEGREEVNKQRPRSGQCPKDRGGGGRGGHRLLRLIFCPDFLLNKKES